MESPLQNSRHTTQAMLFQYPGQLWSDWLILASPRLYTKMTNLLYIILYIYSLKSKGIAEMKKKTNHIKKTMKYR